VDDTDKARSKTTRTIAHVHKLHDKASGGFIMGQNRVFLLLVSELITVPVGFAFYEPDPVQTRWAKQERALKKQGVAKRQRPPKPPRNPAYPTKLELGLCLAWQFRQYHPTIRVQCVLADALYGSAAFVDTASAIFGGIQVISQLRSNQKVRFRNRTPSVTVKKKAKKDEQTSRRPKRHNRGEDVMSFIYRPVSNTAQGTSNVR
jgi:hypothetical protein